MRKSRYTQEQIVGILKEYEAGAKVDELTRRHGMSSATFYKWKAKYAEMDVSEVRRLRELEEENAKLKKLLADAMLDNDALKTLLAKKWRRDAVATVRDAHALSTRSACRLVGISRSANTYRPRPDKHARLRLCSPNLPVSTSVTAIACWRRNWLRRVFG